MPYFFDTLLILLATVRSSKSRNLPIIVGVVGVFIVVILGTIACLLFVFQPLTDPRETAATSQAKNLPTIPVITATPNPLLPEQILFTAQEPIKGFSDCDNYGFKGSVFARNETHLDSVQVVVWEDETGLLAIDTLDKDNTYSIELPDAPEHRQLWLQVYENDAPASRAVLVEIQFDCLSGFQIYQVDWQRVEGN